MGMSKKLIYGIKVDRNHEAGFCPEPRRWVVARNGDIWVCSSLRRYGWIMTWRANRRTWLERGDRSEIGEMGNDNFNWWINGEGINGLEKS